MLRFLALVFLALLPVAAWSGPAESPPADFTGTQYIDSRGCVFRQQDGQWLPRQGPGGAPVCGYPPTFSAPDAPGLAGVAAPAPPAPGPRRDLPGDPLQRVAAAVYAGVQASDLADAGVAGQGMAGGGGDNHGNDGSAAAPDAPPATSGDARGDMTRTLGDAIAADARLRSQMAAELRPNDRLCDLLGYRSALPGQGGANTAGGYCHDDDPAMPDWAAMVRQAGGTTVADAKPAVAPKAATGQSPSADGTARGAPSGRASDAGGAAGKAVANAAQAGAASRVAAPDRGGVTRSAAGARPNQTEMPQLIPAGTRYLSVGIVPDDAQAQAVALQLARLGYPVARRRQDHADTPTRWQILTGPFADREAVVRALNHLRLSGFPGTAPP